MADSSEDRDVLLNRLADEFAARHRAGQHPSLEEYCARYPELADDIRSLFPAMVELERVKADAGADLAVESADTPPITELGDFRLLREVGRGGMGVVYEAEQVSLGRRVAIKLLPASVFRDPDRRARFEREAKAAARLHHTNIVPVFGVGEHDGTPYYVMQFIPGLPLDAVIGELGLHSTTGENRPANDDRSAMSAVLAHSLVTGSATGPLGGEPEPDQARTVTALGPPSHGSSRSDRSSALSLGGSGVHLPGQPKSGSGRSGGSKTAYWGSVARIGLQVAGALAYAHKLGVLHRDVKPGNLLLDLDGVVWVTDFGLAKADDSDNLTHTGDVLGTLRYMPPEAFEGKSDARSDVYSLGLTLFELVALRPAYEERDRKKLIKRVTTGEAPRLRKLRTDAPRDLVTIVEKAVDRDPARRYPTAQALADDLQRFLDRRPILARRSGPAERVVRWAKRNPVVAGAAAAVLIALTVGTTVSYLKYREAERQQEIALVKEQEARRQAERAQKARDFLVSIFRISERDLRNSNVTARQILAEADRRIPVEFADQPELRDELIAAIADVKRGIARRVPQAMILESSGDVRRRSAGGESRPVDPQALVNLDDRIAVGPGGHARLVFLSDFHKEVVKPDREVTIDGKGCDPPDAVAERDKSILMSFVRLPKGTFYMGYGLAVARGNGPKKGVKTVIPADFEIAVHLVTQGQWAAVMGNNPSTFSRTGPVKWKMQDISDEELKLFPVDGVSWEDAQAFVRKVNELERGRGYRYRLPTEAEWEYACRCGATTEEECSHLFYLDRPTDALSSDQANFNGNYPAGGAAKGPFLWRTTRVGAYPPNRLGLCDMHGNVWQWCEAAYPGAPQVAGRGGMLDSDGMECQANSRSLVRPGFRDHTRGFRLVRVREE